MSFILSIGKPVWYPIVDTQPGQWSFVFGWFSIIILDFDFDAALATNKDIK